LRLRFLFASLALTMLLVGCGGGDDACRDEPGSSCVWAGTGEAGFNGDGHDRTDTRLYWPVDVSFGPDGTPWIVDWNNNKVREVLQDGSVRTAVSLFHPTDVEFGPDGLIYIADWHNYKLVTLDAATGLVRILGGDAAGFAGDGGSVDEALFNLPSSLVFAPDGSLYILDQANQRVRRMSPDGTVDTVVGSGRAGFAGDGGPPPLAQLNFGTDENADPSGGLALGPDGSLYIADALNYRIRRADLDAGVIETVAGNGVAALSGDGGAALAAGIGLVSDIEFGPDGRLYLADAENNCVRAVNLDTGVIEMVWNGDGSAGQDRADGIVLDNPSGIAFGPDGYLYIADTLNHRIVRVVPPG
jgi:sugar lactone lactonase YvrE